MAKSRRRIPRKLTNRERRLNNAADRGRLNLHHVEDEEAGCYCPTPEEIAAECERIRALDRGLETEALTLDVSELRRVSIGGQTGWVF